MNNPIKFKNYSLDFNCKLLALLKIFAVIFSLSVVSNAYSQAVQIRAAEHPGFGRMVLDSSLIFSVQAVKNKPRNWTLKLNKAITNNVGILVKLLPNYIERAVLDQSGLSLNIVLRDDFMLEQNTYGTAIILDWLIKKGGKAFSKKSYKETKLKPVSKQKNKQNPPNNNFQSLDINKGLKIRADAFASMGRITFWGNQQLKPIISSSKKELRLSFKEHIISQQNINTLVSLGFYIKDYKLSDGTLILTFQENIVTTSLRYLNSFIIDLYNENKGNNVRAFADPTATQIGVPKVITEVKPKAKENIVVRLGEHPDFVRLVFDWPYQVNYLIDHKNDQLDITFGRQAKFVLPTFPKSISSILGPLRQEELNGSSRVSFTIPQSISVIHKRFENKIILDIRVSERNAIQDLVDNLNSKDNKLITGKETLVDSIIATRGRNKESVSNALAVLYFDWIDPVGAALFQHRDTIWIVFDALLKLDTYDLIQQTQEFFKDVQVIPSLNSTVIRLTPKQNFYASIEQSGFTWLVRFDAKKIQNPRPLNVNVLSGTSGFELHVPTGKSGKVISIVDPVTYERLLVGTLPSPGYAINKAYAYPGLQFPVTQQGVLVVPQDESIKGKSESSRFIFFRPGGLAISPFSQSISNDIDPQQSVLDLSRWDPIFSSSYGSAYITTKLTLEPNKSKKEVYKNITSQYLAHGFYPEALGSAKAMEQYYINSTEKQDVEALLLMSASAVMRQDRKMINFWINRFEISKFKETALWRGVDAAINGDWQTARSFFKNTDSILDSYSSQLKADIYLLQLQGLVKTKDQESIDIFLNRITANKQVFSKSQQRWINYLRAEVALMRKSVASAIKILNDLTIDKTDKAASYGKLLLVKHQMESKTISTDDAIEVLENLRISWRGDDLELKTIQLLSQLYAKQHKYKASLKNYRQALTYFSKHPLVFGIRHDMLGLFRSLFSETKNALPVIELLKLYNEFRELVPSGPDGNRLTEVLANRLYFDNYFSQSKDIFQRQFNFRLTKDEKRRIAIKLAIIYLALNDPQNAEKILDEAKGNNLPVTDIRRQDAQLLRAYLYASKNERKKAINLLSGVINLEADLLRRDIALKDENWSALILALERLTGPPPESEDIILPAPIQRHLVTWAIALNKLNDKEGLIQLEKHYFQSLPDNNVKKLFSLLISGSGDPAQLLESMQNLDTLAPLTSFISLLRNRYFSS